MVNAAPLLLLLVVNPSVPVQSVQELIAYAKVHPGQLNYGSGGVGSTPYLATELLKSMTGIDVVHVPYKGGAPALADLMAGQLAFMIENVPGTLPLMKSGKLRALAITSAQRSSLVPNLPTMAEAGVAGYEMVGWNGVFVAKGTPRKIVAPARHNARESPRLAGSDRADGDAGRGAWRRHAASLPCVRQRQVNALGQYHQRKGRPPRVELGADGRFTTVGQSSSSSSSSVAPGRCRPQCPVPESSRRWRPARDVRRFRYAPCTRSPRRQAWRR
jgi:hypothetical protein